jgi:hypothetical protein
MSNSRHVVAQGRISRRATSRLKWWTRSLRRAFARAGRSIATDAHLSKIKPRCTGVIASASEAIQRAANSKDGLLRRKGPSQ